MLPSKLCPSLTTVANSSTHVTGRGAVFCLFVCLFACLFVCLFACLFVCLLACLFVCLFFQPFFGGGSVSQSVRVDECIR